MRRDFRQPPSHQRTRAETSPLREAGQPARVTSLSPLGEHNDREEDEAKQIRDGGKCIQAAEVEVNGSVRPAWTWHPEGVGCFIGDGQCASTEASGGGPLQVRAT
jgi:hypothetical protein